MFSGLVRLVTSSRDDAARDLGSLYTSHACGPDPADWLISTEKSELSPQPCGAVLSGRQQPAPLVPSWAIWNT